MSANDRELTVVRPTQAGTMVIRLIAPSTDLTRFRARLTFESATAGDVSVQYATSLEELLRVVHDWAVAGMPTR